MKGLCQGIAFTVTLIILCGVVYFVVKPAPDALHTGGLNLPAADYGIVYDKTYVDDMSLDFYTILLVNKSDMPKVRKYFNSKFGRGLHNEASHIPQNERKFGTHDSHWTPQWHIPISLGSFSEKDTDGSDWSYDYYLTQSEGDDNHYFLFLYGLTID